MDSRILKATELAVMAHAGQVRKYTGEPYVVHPIRVAERARWNGLPPKAIILALLHDVIEDTNVTELDIANQFGDEIAGMVVDISDLFPKSYGNRAKRKSAYKSQLSEACSIVQSVKCLDMEDNTSSIARHDPSFARLYLREKWEMLSVMDRADTIIRNRVMTDLAELIQSMEVTA